MRFYIVVMVVASMVGACKKKKSEKKQVGAPKLEKIVSGSSKLDPHVSWKVFRRRMVRGKVFVRQIYLVFNKVSPRFGKKLRAMRANATSGRRSMSETQSLLKEVLKKARGGADFKALMKQYSDDPHSGPRGYLIEVVRDGTPSPAS